MTVAEVGGQLVFTLATTGSHYAGYLSASTYRLTGNRLYVEVPVLPAGDGAEVYLRAMRGNNILGIIYVAGTGELHLQYDHETSGEHVVGKLAHDTSMRWWQIREAAGVTYWETSPDGKSWVTRASAADPMNTDHVYLMLMAGAYQDVAPTKAAFASFNGGGAPSEQYCPASSLSDDFADGVQGLAWGDTWQDAGCRLAEEGGELVARPPVSQVGHCAYQTSSAFRLTGSSVTVKVSQVGNGKSVATLVVQSPAADQLGIRAVAGQVHFRSYINDTLKELASPIAWSTATRWWRLREAGGTCFWETSADGKTWQTRASEPCPIDVTRVAISLGSGADGPEPAPGEVRFDNLNLPP